ncbi:MAG: hypothetical protein V1883_03605 [Candidatus Omnitrophota bacterium]
MKKIAIVLLILAFISSVPFAQAASEGKKSIAEKAQTVVGKIVSVTLINPAKGITEGAITIADETGKTATYIVKTTAKILSDTLNAITLNQLKKGDKIQIEKSSANEVKSVKVVKK